jgi:8-oxo-dGDP phosphatase
MSDRDLEPTKRKIFGERLVDENPFIRLSIASVGLPDGTEFEQYVMRMRRTATTAVVNDHGQVLLMWRYRFIIDRWVWEMPGGYVDQAEDPTAAAAAAAAAAREVEEATGWRLSDRPELVMTFQPMIGNADSPQDLYYAVGAERVVRPDVNESDRIAWIAI